ncbi:hypothetical protein PsYK624_053420 [Phanerochaete sordida]|uniref:Uncharacterized protein n=1 Tax=Phanerochaete sordida TaxID=48140 RepID=A0A9P3LB94_9APHY|nr:hypothetical protein PsYK624_053420 [Phanerochaete sordida]
MAPYIFKLGQKVTGCVLDKRIEVILIKVDQIETINRKPYKAHVGEWVTADGITIRHTFVPELYNDLLP